MERSKSNVKLKGNEDSLDETDFDGEKYQYPGYGSDDEPRILPTQIYKYPVHIERCNCNCGCNANDTEFVFEQGHLHLEERDPKLKQRSYLSEDWVHFTEVERNPDDEKCDCASLPPAQRESISKDRPIPQRASFSNDGPIPQRDSFSNDRPIPQQESFFNDRPIPQQESFSNDRPIPQRESFSNDRPIHQRESFSNDRPIPQRESFSNDRTITQRESISHHRLTGLPSEPYPPPPSTARYISSSRQSADSHSYPNSQYATRSGQPSASQQCSCCHQQPRQNVRPMCYESPPFQCPFHDVKTSYPSIVDNTRITYIPPLARTVLRNEKDLFLKPHEVTHAKQRRESSSSSGSRGGFKTRMNTKNPREAGSEATDSNAKGNKKSIEGVLMYAKISNKHEPTGNQRKQTTRNISPPLPTDRLEPSENEPRAEPRSAPDYESRPGNEPRSTSKNESGSAPGYESKSGPENESRLVPRNEHRSKSDDTSPTKTKSITIVESVASKTMVVSQYDGTGPADGEPSRKIEATEVSFVSMTVSKYSQVTEDDLMEFSAKSPTPSKLPMSSMLSPNEDIHIESSIQATIVMSGTLKAATSEEETPENERDSTTTATPNVMTMSKEYEKQTEEFTAKKVSESQRGSREDGQKPRNVDDFQECDCKMKVQPPPTIGVTPSMTAMLKERECTCAEKQPQGFAAKRGSESSKGIREDEQKSTNVGNVPECRCIMNVQPPPPTATMTPSMTAMLKERECVCAEKQPQGFAAKRLSESKKSPKENKPTSPEASSRRPSQKSDKSAKLAATPKSVNNQKSRSPRSSTASSQSSSSKTRRDSVKKSEPDKKKTIPIVAENVSQDSGQNQARPSANVITSKRESVRIRTITETMKIDDSTKITELPEKMTIPDDGTENVNNYPSEPSPTLVTDQTKPPQICQCSCSGCQYRGAITSNEAPSRMEAPQLSNRCCKCPQLQDILKQLSTMPQPILISIAQEDSNSLPGFRSISVQTAGPTYYSPLPIFLASIQAYPGAFLQAPAPPTNPTNAPTAGPGETSPAPSQPGSNRASVSPPKKTS